MFNIFIFSFTFILVSFSLIGYGILAKKFFEFSELNSKETSNEIGIIGLYGIFFLIFLSYLSSFFIEHNYIVNLTILLFGLIIFTRHNYIFKNFGILFLITYLLILVSLIIFKNHDDFHYYHFPYTYLLTELNHPIGLGFFNLGFRTPSSIFFLNSNFYLPYLKEFTFNYGQALILLFANFYFIEKIYFNKEKKLNNFQLIFCVLSYGFINIFFYRLAEHGTDRSAQILIFILLCELLDFLNDNHNLVKFNLKKLYKIIFLILTIISLKAFYIIYLIFLAPVFWALLRNSNYSLLFKLIFSIRILAFFTFAILIFLIYFLNTGCLVYPLEVSCFKNIEWYLGDNEIQKIRLWYEQWAKAGAGPNFRVENPELYVQNFNWISNWIEKYFFNKVSDFLLGLIVFTVLSIMILNLKFKKIIDNTNFNPTYILIILFFLLLEWFLNHPSLRYGGYVLFASLLFILISKYFSFDVKNIQRVNILVTIFLIIFFSRNISRLNYEIKVYNNVPTNSFFYKTDEYSYRVSNQIKNINNKFYKCEYGEEKNCKNLKVKKIFGKYIYLKK